MNSEVCADDMFSSFCMIFIDDIICNYQNKKNLRMNSLHIIYK